MIKINLQIILVTMLILVGSFTFAAEPRVVKIGTFNYYPAIFKDKDGVVKGFYVDALAEIAQRENIRFEYIYGTWSEGLERIKSGEVDVLTSVAFTPERALFMDYGKTPLLTVWGELYTPPGSHVDSILHVEGKKIAVMKDDFNAKHFIDLVKKFNISCEFVELHDSEEVFKAVAAKSVDAGVVNSTFGVARQKDYDLRSTGVVFNPFDIYFAVGKGKNADLCALLDRYLESWHYQQGSVFNEARQRWSHGTTGMIKIMPSWVTKALLALAVAAGAAVVFIVLLRIKVRSKTAAIVAQLAERELIEKTLYSINESGLHNRGDGLLADLTACLGSSLGVEYAFVSRLLPGGDKARTHGLNAMGTRARDVEYDLRGAPCENVIGKELCFYPDNVCQQFPQDKLLVEMGAEGYAAVPLWDSQGIGVGLLGIISKRPLQNRTLVETLLQIVATRAAQELEAINFMKELQEAQAILQTAMDQSTAGIAIANVPDGSLRYVNDAGLFMRGEDRQSVVNGVGIDQYVAKWQLLDLDGRPLEREEVPLARAVLFGEKCSREFIIRGADNNDRIVVANAAPIRNNLNELVAGIVVFMDVTELHRNEEERIKLESQLQQAQKMELIGNLAGGVAHDFNNMLMVIMSRAQLGIMRLDSLELVRDDLMEIMKAAERSADLTRQLLAFARKQTIAPKIMDLNVIIEGMLKMLRRLIGENIHLAWHPAPGLWQIKADPSQIDQILANLCVNARDAIKSSGRITIETRNNTIDARYCNDDPEATPGEYVQLSVSDDGCGMDQETLQHIFEPFFTTKGVGEGTGLGLATTYGIVKQNNGFIKVYSVPDKGTTFTIHLPRHLENNPGPLIETKEASLPKGQETILLVEDEPAILQVTALLLGKQGYTVLTAATPDDALRLAHIHAEDINLLITDVIMPEMNGKDLANKLQSLHPQLKCIYMSGYTSDIIARHGVLDEGVYFIQKPFPLPDLAIKVREVLDSI